MRKGSLRFAAASALLAAPFMWCIQASADDVTVVAPPVTSGDKVTVIHESQTTAAPAPAPATQQVTVVKDSSGDVRIRHEAVADPAVDDDAVASVIVKTAPPEPRQETVRIETKPAEDAVWIAGYWRWDADRNTYEWVPGVWRRAIPGMTWRAGHWTKAGEGYEWIPGYWSSTPAPPTATSTTTTTTTISTPATTTTTTVDEDGDHDTDRIIVRQAPPAVREEVRTTAPGADYVWIAGHWEYRGGEYQWISGRWERPVNEGMMWIGPRWIRNADNTYSFIAGHWDYPAESRTYVVSTDLDDKNSISDDKRRADRTDDQVRERDTNDDDNR